MTVRASWWALMFAPVALSACSGNSPSESAAATVARVEIAPKDTSISVSERGDFRGPLLTYRVRLFGVDGRELPREQVSVEFSSSQPLTAEVDRTGTVFSTRSGNVWIRANVSVGDRTSRDSALLRLPIVVQLSR